MRHMDIFTGIGGWPLGLSQAFGDAYEPVAFCEIDDYKVAVLKKHWPDVPVERDVFQMKGSDYANVDILTASPPCQPYSCAGKRRGTKDDRALWPQVVRVLRGMEPRPAWVCIENVPGLLSIESGLAFESLLTDLEGEGYEVQPLVIPACALDASHRRDRIWIVGYAGCGRKESERVPGVRSGAESNVQIRIAVANGSPDVADAECQRSAAGVSGQNTRQEGNPREPVNRCCEGYHSCLDAWPADPADVPDAQMPIGWGPGCEDYSGRRDTEVGGSNLANARPEYGPTQSRLGRVVDGISRGLDEVARNSQGPKTRQTSAVVCRVAQKVPNRVNRLKCLGDAIVPQIAEAIGRMILAVDPKPE